MMTTRKASPGKGTRAFTLIEMMMAVAILAVGSGMLYETARASMFLTAKNSSLNVGNAGVQQSFYKLLTTLEASPVFVDCATYDPVGQTFTAVSNGTWANSVRFMTLIPISFWVKPDSPSTYTPTNPPPPTYQHYLPSTDQFVFLYYNSAVDPMVPIPANARIYPSFPYVSETVTGGPSPGVKPGLGFQVQDTTDGVTNNPPEAGFYMNNTLGNNAFLDCNKAYIIYESAFAVVPGDTPTSRNLVYFSNTSTPSSNVIICRDLDNSAQTQAGDSTIPTGGTTGTFCMVSGSNAVQVLLPVRARQFVNILANTGGTSAGGSAAKNNAWINVNSKFHMRIFF
jgi:prepilin-type N-terminal cleavage/methylation domain-containing protein